MKSLALAALGCCLSAFAYAGSVTGTITFEGTPPAMKPINMAADPVCHAKHQDEPQLNEALVLGPGQTMANVLVRVVSGLPAGQTYPAPEQPAVLTQEGCMYKPRVFGVVAGQKLEIKNPDGTIHNVNCKPVVNEAFNKGMPKTLESMEVVFEKPEDPFEFRCDVHTWMRAYCLVSEHPYFTVTQLDGAFKIDGLAPGEYEIEAWHERLGAQRMKVTVAEGEPAKQDFSFKVPAKA